LKFIINSFIENAVKRLQFGAPYAGNSICAIKEPVSMTQAL